MIKLEKKFLLKNNKDKIRNKRVLLRVDYNVEIKNGKVLDNYRIKESLETIKFLNKNGAKQIILITHFGRPKNKEKKFSTIRLIPLLRKYIKKIEYFNWRPNLNLPVKNILILENIRFFKEEEENDYRFAQKLSKLADIFVNEAFSASHRKHASIYQISKILPTYWGLNFEKEIKNLNLVFVYFKKGKRIAVVIGGIKFETKIELIKNFLKKVDLIILTGGLANTFLKGKGFEIGNSLFDKEYLEFFKNLHTHKVLVPFDFITNKGHRYLGEIQKDEIIYDVGKKSIELFLEELKKKDLVIWNGPLGKIEEKEYRGGSVYFAHCLVGIRNRKIIGGGETLSIANKIFKNDRNTFISTGGGAMLYYLAKGNLPFLKNVRGF